LTKSEWSSNQILVKKEETDDKGITKYIWEPTTYSDEIPKAFFKKDDTGEYKVNSEYCHSEISRIFYPENDSCDYKKFITPIQGEITSIEHSKSYDVQINSILYTLKKQGISNQAVGSKTEYNYDTSVTKIIYNSDKTGIYINPTYYKKGDNGNEYYTLQNSEYFKLNELKTSDEFVSDDIINNTLNYSVVKSDLFDKTFKVDKANDLTGLVYHY